MFDSNRNFLWLMQSKLKEMNKLKSKEIIKNNNKALIKNDPKQQQQQATVPLRVQPIYLAGSNSYFFSFFL